MSSRNDDEYEEEEGVRTTMMMSHFFFYLSVQFSVGSHSERYPKMHGTLSMNMDRPG